MKIAVFAVMIAAVLASPCIYDVMSNEPSPLAVVIGSPLLGAEANRPG
jgi:RsiW-degrading membrane proteinase PrsW (M82 family)